MPTSTNALADAAHSYRTATGHTLPRRLTLVNLPDFLITEIKRYSGQPGIAAQLLMLLGDCKGAA